MAQTRLGIGVSLLASFRQRYTRMMLHHLVPSTDVNAQTPIMMTAGADAYLREKESFHTSVWLICVCNIIITVSLYLLTKHTLAGITQCILLHQRDSIISKANRAMCRLLSSLLQHDISKTLQIAQDILHLGPLDVEIEEVPDQEWVDAMKAGCLSPNSGMANVLSTARCMGVWV